MAAAKSNKRRNAIWGLNVALMVLAGIAIWWFAVDSRKRSSKRTDRGVAQGETTGAPAVGSFSLANPQDSEDPFADMPRDEAGDIIQPPGVRTPETVQAAVALAKENLANARELYKYPDWSRPIDASDEKRWNWKRPDEPETDVVSHDATGRTVSADLYLDKLFVGPGQTMTATVHAWIGEPGEPSGLEADVTVTGEIQAYNWELAEADPSAQTGPGDDMWVPLYSAPFTKKGSVWTLALAPADIPALQSKLYEVRFVAWVHLGEDEKPLSIKFHYSSKPPFKVLGIANERVKDGNLEIELDVEVLEVAPILIEASLFAGKNDIPVAIYSDYVRPTKVGRQRALITYFGKMLADTGINGPYKLKGIHGWSFVTDRQPPEKVWSYDGPDLLTKAHPASAFSSGEWSGEDKNNRIETLEKFIKDMEDDKL